MIPYFQFERLFARWHLPIQPFGVLLVLAVWVGYSRTEARARELGIDDRKTSSMFWFSLVLGFLCAHVFDLVVYEKPPSLATILNPFAGLSSYGGFAGALSAMFIWCKWKREPYLMYVDACGVGLAPGWLFGRLGCFTAHDHPGRLSNFILAVRYPGGARHDLGLYEALVALGVTLLFWRLGRRKRPIGVYTILGCLVYGPARFLLDFLRADDLPGSDPRYLGLTPAQYGSIVVFAIGLALLARMRNARYSA